MSLYCDFVTNTIWDTYKGARHGVLSCMEKSFDNSSDMSFKAWHSMTRANLNKSEKIVTNTIAASKYIHSTYLTSDSKKLGQSAVVSIGPESASIKILPFRPKFM